MNQDGSEVVSAEAVPNTQMTLPPQKPKDFAAIAKLLTEEQLIAHIKHGHEQAQLGFRQGIAWAYATGLYLYWVKKKVVPHGDWKFWVQANCPFDIRQAQRYKRLVEKWEEIEAKASSEDAFEPSVAGLLEDVAEPKAETIPPKEIEEQSEEKESDGEQEQEEPEEDKPNPPEKRKQPKLRIAPQEDRKPEDTEENPEEKATEEEDMVPVSFIVNCNMERDVYDIVAKEGNKVFLSFNNTDFEIEGEASDFELERKTNVELPE